MKILYLITKSEAGGAQTHIWQLSNYLQNNGHQVAVMALPGGWLDKGLQEIGIKFSPNHFLANSFNPFRCILAIKEIKKTVRDFQPDLISCHSTAAGFWTRMGIRNKVPTVFTAHGWGFAGGTPLFRKYPIVLAEKLASQFCEKIICVSDYDKKLALNYGIADPLKIVTIHNGVEIQGDISDKELSIPLKIVFVGRFVPQKDQLLFCKAFLGLKSELKERAQIAFVGDGPLRNKVEEYVKASQFSNHFQFLGELRRDDVFKVLKQSNLFVLIANWEGFPRSILEAMSCGLPVVASDVGGVSEVVDNSCGLLVKKGDLDDIQRALIRMIEEPELIKKLGQKAKQKVENSFSLDKMLSKTEQLYQEILAK
jgi:glycosyltransferase involved in cell wall biosynthesis